MKKFILILFFLSLQLSAFCQGFAWQIVKGKITTPWADSIRPQSVLQEYPRPQMVRGEWLNLNGLWDYTINERTAAVPTSFEGKILVPFAIESALSGVGKKITKDQRLWYRHTVKIPATFNKKNVLLHFGAVDWQCDVYVNGEKAGSHEGGYDPFYFDITTFLKKSGEQEIVVSVWDPSDSGPQPRGKQVTDPTSIWYTPVTGIWQTVWLEAVNSTYISSTKNTPSLDRNEIHVQATISNLKIDDKVRISVWDGTQKIAEKESAVLGAALAIPNPKIWSPTSPYLYDLKVSIVRKGKVIDEVKSYFAMRKIAMQPDQNGAQRLMLNNKALFQYGPLDQGWWPDGLYTAPSDEALQFDIITTKAMGFNMIRKHVKVEPARWYYHCDKLGILVWQDMPSGDMGNTWDSRPGIIGVATDKERTPESEVIFKKEWKAIIDATYNFPSIVVWVPFNEAWGQFKTKEIVEWTMEYDSSRLVNEASGGNFHSTGHMLDLHNYPSPALPDPKLFGTKQALVLGEFGGLGLPLEGHTWQTKDNWGYQSFSSTSELEAKYSTFIGHLKGLVKQGLSAAVYTQTTDVEIEVNGLMTYDRKVIKIPADKLSKLHAQLYGEQ